MKRVFLLIGMVLLLSPGIYAGGEKEAPAAEEPEEQTTSLWSEEEKTDPNTLEFGDLFGGLHFTGDPVDLDEESYRLSVTGKVDTPLSLTLAEVKALGSDDRQVKLVCPGFFTDDGVWNGVLVRRILEEAGIQADAETVIFAVPDESYRTRFPVDRALEEDFLIAWGFEGEVLHRVHGFPLRLVAGNTEGSNWVKWLQIIRVE